MKLLYKSNIYIVFDTSSSSINPEERVQNIEKREMNQNG